MTRITAEGLRQWFCGMCRQWVGVPTVPIINIGDLCHYCLAARARSAAPAPRIRV